MLLKVSTFQIQSHRRKYVESHTFALIEGTNAKKWMNSNYPFSFKFNLASNIKHSTHDVIAQTCAQAPIVHCLRHNFFQSLAFKIKTVSGLSIEIGANFRNVQSIPDEHRSETATYVSYSK